MTTHKSSDKVLLFVIWILSGSEIRDIYKIESDPTSACICELCAVREVRGGEKESDQSEDVTLPELGA